MIRENFLKELKRKRCVYELEGDTIIVNSKIKNVNLTDLESIPPNIEFINIGDVHLESLKYLPANIKFNNGGVVYLYSLLNFSPGTEFNNGGAVQINQIVSIPPGVMFNNRGDCFLPTILQRLTRWSEWEGNIPGINPNSLLTHMIQKGIFSE